MGRAILMQGDMSIATTTSVSMEDFARFVQDPGVVPSNPINLSSRRLAYFRAIGRRSELAFSQAYLDQLRRSTVGLTYEEITRLLTMADADILRKDRFSGFMADVVAEYNGWLQSPAAPALPARRRAQQGYDPIAEAIR